MNAEELTTSFPLMRGVEPNIVDMVLAEADLIDFQRGQSLYQHGENASHVMFLNAGWVKLCRETADGEEVILDIQGKGSILGKGLALGETSLPYHVVAVDDGAYLSVPVKKMTQAILQSQLLSINLLQAMSRQGHRQTTELEHLAVQKAPQRIGCFLLGLANEDYGPANYDLPFDKSLLAGKLGMKPETFSRALSQLRGHGVRVDKKKVHIEDIERLSDYTCMSCSKVFPCDQAES
jgi:CRP-like cAMP-binding protein